MVIFDICNVFHAMNMLHNSVEHVDTAKPEEESLLARVFASMRWCCLPVRYEIKDIHP